MVDARKAEGGVVTGGCKRRVWDNGDMTDCGDPVVVGGLCEIHRTSTLNGLREEVLDLRHKLTVNLTRIAELDSDEVNDRLALVREFGVKV